MNPSSAPKTSYGVLHSDCLSAESDDVVEQIRRLGYAVLDSGYSKERLQNIADAFERIRKQYINTWGELRLKSLHELHTIRALLVHGESIFLDLAMNPGLIGVVQKLIVGKFILNQQNGIINPAREEYNQGAWHRDLPYQHYVSSSPLAVNALFCLDDFSFDNGATFVLPGSHKVATFPSKNYIERNAIQIEAVAGQYILLDCMLYHGGGFNKTLKERRAINHVFTIPFFKQQINLPKNMLSQNLSPEEKLLLGFDFQEPPSITAYLESRSEKFKQRLGDS